MKINIKKYFVTILALLLILSNFSFAASYMYCRMSKALVPCVCEDESMEVSAGLTIDQNACCLKEIKELSNTNNILSYNFEFKHLISSDFTVINYTEYTPLNKIQFLKHNIIDRSPPPDIVLTTSALLI